MRLRFLQPLSVLLWASLFAACDQRPADPALPTTDVTWTTIRTVDDYPHSADAVWASGADDVYVGEVMARGQLSFSHFDGVSWTPIPVSWPDDRGRASIWGSGPADVYVATGHLNHFNGATWTVLPVDANLVTGTSVGQVFIANSAAILEYNGAAWDTLLTPDRSPGALVAAPDGSLFAGWADSVSIWNGLSWIDASFPGRCAFDVCAFAFNDAYLLDSCTGTDKIYHWDGVQWTMEAVGVDGLLALAGTGPSNLIATGRDGTVVHYDGTSWEAEARMTGLDLWVASGTHAGLVVAGDQNKVLWLGDNGWQVLREADLVYDSFAMCAESASRMMVADRSSVFRFDHGVWSETPLPLNSRGVNALAGRSLRDVYALEDGRLVAHYNGSEWDAVDSLAAPQYALWVSPGGTAYSAGDAAVYRNGTAWEPIKTGVFSMFVLTGDGGEGIVTAGVDYNLLEGSVVWHFDGNAWSALPPPGESVYAMWSGPGMDLYLAAEHGIYHWDGARFARLPGPERSFYVIIFGTAGGRVVAMNTQEAAFYEDGFLSVSPVRGPHYATIATDGSIVGSFGGEIAFWKP